MKSIRRCFSVVSVVLCAGIPIVAHAQLAVVDARAIVQLVQQLSIMRDQLEQGREQLESMRGTRGMERLAVGAVRNYLPPDWQQLAAVLDRTSRSYGALAAEFQRLTAANAVLTDSDIDAMSPDERSQLEAARRSAALLQGITRSALATTSERFSSIQTLIDAIPQARDQKAILDLQARIQAEQGMLQNEATKLGVLYQVTHAEEWARRQRADEQAMLAVGTLRDLPPMGL